MSHGGAIVLGVAGISLIVTTTLVYVQGASAKKIAKLYLLTLSGQLRTAWKYADVLNEEAKERKAKRKEVK
jgi:hypothetical protein